MGTRICASPNPDGQIIRGETARLINPDGQIIRGETRSCGPALSLEASLFGQVVGVIVSSGACKPRGLLDGHARSPRTTRPP